MQGKILQYLLLTLTCINKNKKMKYINVYI